MALFLVKQPDSVPTVHKTKRLVVQAESAADARIVAAAYFNGDASWADATATAITASTLDDNASMLGYTFTITVTGAAGQTVDPLTVSTVGEGTDDLDAIAADLVTALNATADIANAAYSAPNLTVATGSGGDDLGDGTIVFTVTPPSGDTKYDLSALFVGAGGITDGGVSTDALAIALVADTESTPKVLIEA